MYGEMSRSADVLSEVLQGTILDPLLFLCYVNDLPSVVSPGTEIRPIADGRLPCLQGHTFHRRPATVPRRPDKPVELAHAVGDAIQHLEM